MHDEITGETIVVRTRTVINAAGAWAAGFPKSGVRLRLTKGVHLVVDRQRLPVSEAIVLTQGQRILFAIPWGERIILGTTDTDYVGDPRAARTDPADVRYILDVVNAAFPEVRLEPADVIATWAGVRPLIAPRQAKAGAPSDISRGHLIQTTEPGWFDIAGGKLTTYRLMAQQLVDRVGGFLGRRLPKSLTAERTLSRGPFSGVLPPPVEQAVVAECCRREWAIHLDDVLLRRTSWHFYHADHEPIAGRTLGWMAAELGWSPQRQTAELDRYRALSE